MTTNQTKHTFPALQDSLENKIAGLCIIGAGSPAYTVETEFRERMEKSRFAGIGIFPHNIFSEMQVQLFMKGLQKLADLTQEEKLPFYVSVDEEAGSLSNFKKFFPFLPGNRAVALADDPEIAFKLGRMIGSQLHALEIPMDWGPVLDVNTNIASPVIGIRSFGEDPGRVTELGEAYIRGMREAGVASTAKHFPGHGQVSGDSHYVLPQCDFTLEQLYQGPLIPFVRAIGAGVDSIMVAHITYPSIPEAGDLPASLNPFFVTELLRNRLGYDGVICTDDIEMGAIMNHWEPEEIGRLALLAGNDLILMCHTPHFQERVMKGMADAVRSGEIQEAQIDASLERIRRLKRKFTDYRLAAKPLPRDQWEDEALYLAAATQVLKRDPKSLLPLKAESKILLVVPEQRRLTVADSSNGAEPILKAALERAGLQVDQLSCELEVKPDELQQIIGRAESGDYDCVLLGTINAHQFTGQLELAGKLAEVKPLVTLVLRNPYDADLLPQQAAVTLVCSTSDFSMQAWVNRYVTTPINGN